VQRDDGQRLVMQRAVLRGGQHRAEHRKAEPVCLTTQPAGLLRSS
jgi:hypothetical protein